MAEKSKSKLKRYSVYARVCVVVERELTAESLTSALEATKILKESQFVSYGGALMDGTFEVIGVQDADWRLHEE